MSWEILLNDPRSLPPVAFVVYACGGIIGALVKVILDQKGVLDLPRRTKTHLHLGFLANLAIGMVAAILADGNFLTAILSGIAGGVIIDSAVVASKRASQQKPPE